MILTPQSRLHILTGVIRQFTPNWFTATMGTGVLALALNQIDGPSSIWHAVAFALWGLALALFCTSGLLYALRWAMFFDEAKQIYRHAVAPMFLGAIPMALATVINGFLAFITPHLPVAIGLIALPLWWMDALMAAACAWALPHWMFTRLEHRLDSMTAVWLLPMVAAEVAAVSGGQILHQMAPGPLATTVLYVSYSLWSLSVFPAMGVLVILFLRMVLHKLPPPEMAISSWLALGPIGTGALGLIVLGREADRMFTGTHQATLGAIASQAGVFGALLLWGYGLYWLITAALITLRELKRKLPFNLGWWGLTFPLGVYALSTLALARATDTYFFQVLGQIFVMTLAVLWSIVAWRTTVGIYRGGLFVAPCLGKAG